MARYNNRIVRVIINTDKKLPGTICCCMNAMKNKLHTHDYISFIFFCKSDTTEVIFSTVFFVSTEMYLNSYCDRFGNKILRDATGSHLP